MIKNRNIAPDAFIDATKIAGSDIGEVRYVVRENSNSHALLKGRVPSSMLYLCDGTADEVQINQAITASKGGTNSYIYVFPGAYTLAAAITMAGRSSLHLVAANGTGYEVGAVGAAALTQGGSCEAVIMEAYGELAGFQIINKAGYSAVTVATGKWRMNIHNNYFHMTQGTACSIITATGTGLSYGRLANNRFETWVGGNFTAPISIAGATACDVCNNIITMNSGTVDFGITMGNSAQSTLINNIVSDCNGGATIGIVLDLVATVGITAVGNRIACATGGAIGGGTANRSFIDNRDSYAGGETAIES